MSGLLFSKPSDGPPSYGATASSHDMADEDIADTGEVADDVGFVAGSQHPPVPDPPPSRPSLQRNSYQAAPTAPPAPDPPISNHAPTDSLSLQQLRQIVQQVNRADPAAYDFAYADTGPHAEEIDEWFVYQFWQWVRLNSAQKAFEWHWDQEAEEGKTTGWDDSDHDTRARFVRAAIAGVQSNDAALRCVSIGKLVYLVLGRWGDTAMGNAPEPGTKTVASIPQLQAIKAGVQCLMSLEGLPVVWQALRECFEAQWNSDMQQPQQQQQQQQQQQTASSQEAEDELVNLMTIMYMCVQDTLNDNEDMSMAHQKLLELNPSLVDFMLTATSKLRWDENCTMPQTQIFLLFWKSLLLVFGGSREIDRIKQATSEAPSDSLRKDKITASPLDYHNFRQEITSKYPAYVPPQTLIPLEAENHSLLPPLPNQAARSNGLGGIFTSPAGAQNGGASILNQPVHIATPAPSPPPSPAVGGKGGKKQNYQTNQNFPFMYPPLDATSNSAGGKGVAGMGIHAATVNRRWEGSDVPASILEAGELFSTRVRMTRATRQLWDEREKFMTHERGWDEDDEDDELEGLNLDELSLEEREILKGLKAEDATKRPKPAQEAEVDYGPHPDNVSERDKQRLALVESFYRGALPHLQSLVIVLLRPILVNVTAAVAAQPAQPGPAGSGMAGRGQNMSSNAGTNGGLGGQRMADGSDPSGHVDAPELTLDEIDSARTREITSKAMSGILVLLLKWFRLSHVLKAEYLTQLLLDSNYIPLVLKLFAHQDIQQVVDSKMDRSENSFFQFCNLRSKSKEGGLHGHVEVGGEMIEESDDDEAMPPPIKRQRSPAQHSAFRSSSSSSSSSINEDDDDHDLLGDEQGPTRPEVDELGYPVNPLPSEPITVFSWRNFFSLINYLRIMQKICKGKAHRNLLLVQYKSSTILRKSLRVPQPELRLYTLKLFKNQVPYCGRKWRQSNMRVITAVYLHCRPELRDEWLAGSDVDAEVDAALPLEQALRSLTHWLNTRRYPDGIALELRATAREEQNFFTRELEKLDTNWTDFGNDGMSEADHYDFG